MYEDDDRDFVRSAAVNDGHRVLYDWSSDESIVTTIVRAVTEVSGREPAECLHDRIDPDGLATLFRREPGDGKRDRGAVTFPFGGFAVTVDATGTIHLVELDRAPR